LTNHEKHILKLVHHFDKKLGVQDHATLDNISAVKKVLKTIIDYRLYQTSRLRKFVASGKNLKNAENRIYRNPTTIRTMNHAPSVDKYGFGLPYFD
jgi:hypothetical protein